VLLLVNIILYFFLIKDFRLKNKYKILVAVLLTANLFLRNIMSFFIGFGIDWISKTVSVSGYFLLGFELLLLFLGVIFIPVKLFLVFSPKITRQKYQTRISAVWITAAILLSVYGLFEANNISVNEISIYSKKIAATNGLKVLQWSDLHLGILSSKYKFNDLIEKSKKINPDAIVITGDMFENKVLDSEYYISKLKNFNPRYGKFFISGNHDDHIPNSEMNDFLNKSGVINLDDDIFKINENIVLIGFKDAPGWMKNSCGDDNEKKILERVDRNTFSLVLKHKPIVSKKISGLFDLMLSGHTHNGQIFPGHILVRNIYEYASGLYEIKNNSFIYVNNGAGTWGPPFRIFSFPEITVFNIQPEK